MRQRVKGSAEKKENGEKRLEKKQRRPTNERVSHFYGECIESKKLGNDGTKDTDLPKVTRSAAPMFPNILH